MTYILDANAFMEASRLYYGFDIAPGFWTWLADPGMAGRVTSIRAVREEITRGSGDLVGWAKGLPASFWRADTDEVVAAMARVAEWAGSPDRKYTQAAVTTFMGSADLSLIAHGLAAGCTVVTREQSAPESKKAIKIPDACAALSVKCTDPFTAYRALGLRLT